MWPDYRRDGMLRGGVVCFPCLLSSFVFGLYYSSSFARSGLLLGAIWARFWKVWASIFQIFQAGLDSIFPVFHEALGSILEVFHEGFGARLDPLGARAGTGWAGGVTRSAKN